MAVQTTGLRYVSEGIGEFISNVQKAQKNLNDLSRNMQANSKTIRDAAKDLNTHTRSLNSMVSSSSALARAQGSISGAVAPSTRSISAFGSATQIASRISSAASLAFQGFSLAGRGVSTAFSLISTTGRTVGGVITSSARGFGNLLSSARSSLATLTGFSNIAKTLALDIGYLTRRVLLLSAAYGTFAAVKNAISLGLQQVVAFDRLSRSLAALTARELLTTGAYKDFNAAMEAAVPIAKENVKWIERLAVISTFESDDIKAVQQFAQAVGIASSDAKVMTFALTAWGTVTGQMPHTLTNIANALTDMFAKGRVQAEEMRQLARNGIPAWDYLAKAVGVSTEEVRKMVSDGLIPAQQGIKAITEGLAKDFGPGLADFTFSVAGITSSLRDLTKINLRAFFTGVVEAAMPFLERMVAVLLQPEVTERITRLGNEFGTLARKVFEFAEAMIASGHPFEFIALKINESLPGFFDLTQRVEKLGSTFVEIAQKAFGFGEGIGKGISEGILSTANLVIDAVQKIADIINNALGANKKRPPSGGGPPIGTGEISQPGGDIRPGGPAPPVTPKLGTGFLDTSVFQVMTDAIDKFNKKADEATEHFNNLRDGFENMKQKALEAHPELEKLTPIVAGLGGAFGVILTSGIASAAFGLIKMLSPIGIITGAIAGIYTAWENNLFGIRDRVDEIMPQVQVGFSKLRDYISNQFVSDVESASKKFSEAWENGQIKIENASDKIDRAIRDITPVAQEISTFFRERVAPSLELIAEKSAPLLQSALNLLASAFENIVIPMLKVFWEVLTRLVWPVIEAGAVIISEVLFPALSMLFDFIAENILPIFRTFFSFMSDVGVPLIEKLSTVILLLIQIAINDWIKKWNEVTTSLQSVMQWIGSLIGKNPELVRSISNLSENISSIIGTIRDWYDSIGGIVGVIQSVIRWLDNLISKLQELASTPAPIIGNSPSPMEMSLRGIDRTLQDLIKTFDRFTRGVIDTGYASKDLAKDFNDIADNVRNFIDDLQEMSLSNLLSGLDIMRNNLNFIKKFGDSAWEGWEDLSQFQIFQVQNILNTLEPQLEDARKRYLEMAKIDPINAKEKFDIESKYIQELSDIELQIVKSKDATERKRLERERDFIYQQRDLEMELFEQQAQRRSEQIEREAQALASAFADAWQRMIGEGLPATPDLTQLYNLILALSQIDLPDWITPGSPTPLEMGIRGISKAVKELAMANLPVLRFQMQQIAQPSPMSQVISRSYSYAYSPSYNLGVTTNQSPQYAFQSFELMRSMYGG